VGAQVGAVEGASVTKLDFGSTEGDPLNGADLSAVVIVNGVLGLVWGHGGSVLS